MPFTTLSDSMRELSSGFKTAKLLDLHFSLVIEAGGEMLLTNNLPMVVVAHTAGEYTFAQGDVAPQKQWFDPRTVSFYPEKTKLFFGAVSRYTATAIFLPKHWFEAALSTDLGFGRVVLDSFVSADPFLTGAAQLLAATPFTPDLVADPLLVEMLAVRLAARILQTLSKAGGAFPTKAQALSTQKLQLISDFVDAHMHRTIRMPELADLVGMSESHFSRSFRTVTGVTPMRFIMGKRVERAKDLLVYTTKPLAEIAFDCGFSSQSHFTTMFKDAIGETPAAFRAGLR